MIFGASSTDIALFSVVRAYDAPTTTNKVMILLTINNAIETHDTHSRRFSRQQARRRNYTGTTQVENEQESLCFR